MLCGWEALAGLHWLLLLAMRAMLEVQNAVWPQFLGSLHAGAESAAIEARSKGLRLPAHLGMLAGGPDMPAQRVQRAQQAHQVGQRACGKQGQGLGEASR